jgi:Zn-finger in ubiquitin-hydrolases and other protein
LDLLIRAIRVSDAARIDSVPEFLTSVTRGIARGHNARMSTCSHLDAIADVAPSGNGCMECLALGMTWVHLRRCTSCGHIGCCDNSQGRHATGHFHGTSHPLIQSYEPGEDWYWCYVDDVAFEIESPQPSPSHR